MNYYNEIKNELINNEIYTRIKNYSKEKNRVITYFRIGNLLSKAEKKYGESIITNYANKLKIEVGKKYNKRTLFRMRQFYLLFKNKKVSLMATQLSWSHYIELLSLNNDNQILYYINQSIKLNLSRNELRTIIKNKEYERLDNNTKFKLSNKKEEQIGDLIKNPIFIKNIYNYENINEKILQKLILENIECFLQELGNNFSFIKSEYKIKLGDTYNYIDLLLYNITFNCYVVIELKVTKLKKEHIGQIEIYMNYIDDNIKNIYQNKTIGIIICKKNNKYIIEYCSDKRIMAKEYLIING